MNSVFRMSLWASHGPSSDVTEARSRAASQVRLRISHALRGRALPMSGAVVSALFVLGPALSPGVVLAYDLGWSPDPRFTPSVLGVDVPSPRVVPSDAAAVLLGHLVGGGLAQKLTLLGVLLLASGGAVALVRTLHAEVASVAALAAALAAQWNPFVAERLVIGQWTVLLGYAVIPWAVRAALRARNRPDATWRCAGWVALGGVGGANTVVMVASAALVVLLWPSPRWRTALATAVSAIGVGAAWWLPALVRGGLADPGGARAFGAAADTPFGLVPSLLSGGGFWNAAAQPLERMSLPVAYANLVVATVSTWALMSRCSGRARGPLAAAGGLGLLIAALSGSRWANGLWTWLVSTLPGAGLLRDGQKFVALWAMLLAVGLALAVDELCQKRLGWAHLGAGVIALVPVLLLPSMAWGFGGRLTAVQVPRDLRVAAADLSNEPAGVVGVLPWGQYRRYEWNDNRVSLGLLPRLVDQRMRYDDSLFLSSGVRVAGEDARSRAVTEAIEAGADPAETLAKTGVRYLAVEREAGLPELNVIPSGRLVVDSTHLLVIDLHPEMPAQAPPSDPVLRSGWGVTLVTLLLAAGASAWRALRIARSRPRGLLCSGS